MVEFAHRTVFDSKTQEQAQFILHYTNSLCDCEYLSACIYVYVYVLGESTVVFMYFYACEGQTRDWSVRLTNMVVRKQLVRRFRGTQSVHMHVFICAIYVLVIKSLCNGACTVDALCPYTVIKSI